jgi:hypothetical protein
LGIAGKAFIRSRRPHTCQAGVIAIDCHAQSAFGIEYLVACLSEDLDFEGIRSFGKLAIHQAVESDCKDCASLDLHVCHV